MSKLVNRGLSFFRSEAKTVGLSPKALAPLIGAGITAVLALAGLTPADIGAFLHVSDAVVAAGEVTIAAKIAAILLGPGNVVAPTPELTAGSDARLSAEAKAKLA